MYKDYKDYKDYIVITNMKLCNGDFLERQRSIVDGNPKALILREKELEKSEYRKLAIEVSKICEAKNVLFYIHSYIDIAREIGCKNIHLSINGIREYKDELLYFDNISVSCHSLEETTEAQKLGATQIVLGTIFETECKPGKKGSGLSFIKEVTDICKLPVYAIGGIKPENIEDVKASGAAGGCMMSWFMING